MTSLIKEHRSKNSSILPKCPPLQVLNSPQQNLPPNLALKQTMEQFIQKMKTGDQESNEQKKLERDIAKAKLLEEAKKK